MKSPKVIPPVGDDNVDNCDDSDNEDDGDPSIFKIRKKNYLCYLYRLF